MTLVETIIAICKEKTSEKHSCLHPQQMAVVDAYRNDYLAFNANKCSIKNSGKIL